MIRLPVRIVEKPWGRTDLPAAFGEFGGRRIGEIWFEDPVVESPMIKFLFTSERLSIQVHPDDPAARAAGFRHGKDECWLVLEATEDAEIGVGLKRSVEAEMLRKAALDGTIEELINWRGVEAGDFLYNGAGVVHAIGAGLILVEVQQNVDCTYRLYDYGRDRDLHLDEGLAVARLVPFQDPRDMHVDAGKCYRLVDGPHFHLIHLSGPEAVYTLPQTPGRFIVVPLSAGCSICGEHVSLGESVVTDRAEDIVLEPGARALLCWAKNPADRQVAP